MEVAGDSDIDGNVFNASLAVVDGAEANTLQSADTLVGTDEIDVLNAQLIPSATLSDGVLGIQPGVAIAPTTSSIEVVNITVQAPATDIFVNGSAIDAGGMEGVQQWWSDDSRGFLQIEDIRSETEETFFGMRETDPGVSYSSYFNALQVDGGAETSVVLDTAGNGAQGGNLNIGAMAGDDGIAVFNVSVDGTSHLSGMMSQNLDALFIGGPLGQLLGGGQNEHLEVVNIESIGDMGDLTVGTAPDDQTDDRVEDGLYDVREVNAGEFAGALNLGIHLNDSDLVNSYFDNGTSEFVFAGGDGGNTFTFDIDADITQDIDFSMEVTGGTSDDRFNFDGLARKDGVTIDGEGGDDTVELTTSTGLLANGNDAFAGFSGIETLVIAGTNDTTQDVVEGNMLGLQEIVVATDDEFDDTTIINLEAETDLAISGKNQTAGTGESNDDQDFGAVSIMDAQGDALNVALDNTARTDGVMTVGSLMIDDESAVEEVSISSNGAPRKPITVRTTSNS